MNRLLLPLLIASLLAGCPKAETAAPTPTTPAVAQTSPGASGLAAQLARYHWYLQGATDAKGQRIDALFVREDKPLQLDFIEGRIGIGNSCNRIGGSFGITTDGISIGPLISTRMACADPKLMALDGEVSRRLEGPLTLLLAESEPPQLRMTNRAGDALSFRAEPTADTRYGGPGERMFLEVAAQTAPCTHPLIPDKRCLQVREIKYDDTGIKVATSDAFRHFYDAIDGYTHQPGIRNVLRVHRYTRKAVPADASKYAYVLDLVVESDSSAKD